MTTFRFKMLRPNVKIGVQVVYTVCTLCATSVLAAETGADNIPVPSGQALSFIEFISEAEGDTVRFRFLTPDIGTAFDYMDVAADFQTVCDDQVIPVLDANALAPSQIVLSMSAVDIPFGEDRPDILQFFEIFRPENGTCIWEEF
jgi:hypothetical protein